MINAVIGFIGSQSSELFTGRLCDGSLNRWALRKPIADDGTFRNKFMQSH
jgi:hypothetical protein